MGKRVAALFTAAALLLSSPVAAQRQLDLPPGQAWIHESTGFGFAAQVDGFTRLKLSDFGKTESDISISYRDEATGTIATLYVFRAGLPDVSIWADRADDSIIQNAERYYGTLDQANRRWSPLTLWGNNRNAGLTVVYGLKGKNLTATGLAMVRHGEWLLKVRMSSGRLDAARLEARLGSFLRALAFPAPAHKAGRVYQIKPCAAPLPTARVTQFESNVQESGVPALFIPPTLPDNRPFCRETTTIKNVTVYRPGGSLDTYVMTLGDGGNSLLVRPWPTASEGRSRPFVSAALVTNDTVTGTPRFDATPGWQQLFDGFGTTSPSFVASRTPDARGTAPDNKPS